MKRHSKDFVNLHCDERCRGEERLRIWWINCVRKHGSVYSYIVGEFIWILSMKNWKQITITNQRLNQTIIEVFGLNANQLIRRRNYFKYLSSLENHVWSHTKIKKLFTGFKNFSADNFMRILKVIYTMSWCCGIKLWAWMWVLEERIVIPSFQMFFFQKF